MMLFATSSFVIDAVITALFTAAWSLFINAGDIGDHPNHEGTAI